MSKRAAVVIRQSDSRRSDSTSLEVQREKAPALAHDFADEVDEVDLGIHTGFSIHFKDEDEERIDNNPRFTEMVERVREGEYDYIVAYDDSRICRDEYFWEVKRAAEIGGAEFVFVDDIPPVESLEFAVNRTVEQKMKEREISKSKEAREKRLEKGAYEGTPPIGTQYDDARMFLEPDDNFEDVLDILRMRDPDVGDGTMSYTEVIEATDITNSRGTLANILDRRETYLELARAHEYDVSDLLDEDDELSEAAAA